MFRLFCEKLRQKYRFGNSISRIHVLYLQTQSLESTPNISISSNQHSPTVSYLVNKCGLPLDSAILVSGKINIVTTDKSDSVLQLFKAYAFTQTHLTKLITKSPQILTAHPLKNLKPKLEFFESLGLSKPDIAEVVSSNSYILIRSLKNQIIPIHNTLKSFLHDQKDIIKALRRWTFAGCGDFHDVVEPNIAVLRDHGVPEANIGKLLMLEPRAIMQKNDRFKEIVKEIEKMKFDRKRLHFVHAISTMGAMGKLRWEKKLEVYKSFGLSEEEFISAFKIQPNFMLTSEKKICKLMNFYINELGLTAADVSRKSNVMLVSFEKTVIPRCSVLLFLLSNGLIKKDISLPLEFCRTKYYFKEKFVNKYEEIAPEVLKAYHGELGYPQLERLRALLYSVD